MQGNHRVWSVLCVCGGILLAGQCVRGDQVRENLPARPGADLAAAHALVVREVLADDTTGREIAALADPFDATRGQLRNWRDAVEAPWAQCWVFQIDDAPMANWEHPCRYVFVKPDLSAYAVRDARSPLEYAGAKNSAREQAGWQPLTVVVPFQRPARQLPAPRATAAGTNAICHAGIGSNCWAVILSGGYNTYNNHIRYWNDSAFIYSTLRQKYGYPRDQIITLISDGRDPAVDRNDGGGVYVNSPIDLDNDGLPDTDGPCTRAEIFAAFARLATTLTTNNQLFVFTTDHGMQVTNTHAVLNLWNAEELNDYELEAITTNLPCPVMFVMEQCFSGGFVDNLDQPQRIITTAADYEHPSWAGDTWPAYNQYVYCWTAAIRGFFPGAHPWEDGTPCNADANEDGYVSFKEATDFAIENKYVDDTPQYQSNPYGLGAGLFMIQNPTIMRALPYLALAGDFDQDGKADPTLWCATDYSWTCYQSGAGYASARLPHFGTAGGLPVFADFDGDHRPDLAFCPMDGAVWSARLSGANYQISQNILNMGGMGWDALAADLDGDGLADPVVYRESDGQWLAKLSGSGYAPMTRQWGGFGWLPAVGDFDGDRQADLILYEYASGNWLVAGSAANYAVSGPFPVSVPGGAPTVGDFDGDGRLDLAVYLPDPGRWCFNLSTMNYMYFR